MLALDGIHGQDSQQQIELMHGEKTLGESVDSVHQFARAEDQWIGLHLMFEGVAG
jgi:hypothetical protein